MMVNLPCLQGSCPNFLRPTCSYTGCQLSFLTGSCPTERTTASHSSCLYLDFTDLPIPHRVQIFRGRITLSRFAGLRDDVVLQVQHRYRVSFQNPARFQNYLEPRKALESFILSTVLCCNHFLLFWTSDVPQHLLRIIDRSFLQNRVDDSQKLAGYYNQ